MVDVNTVVENLDIDSSTKEHLLSQFKDKENLNKMLSIMAAELQELESNAVIPLLDKRTLIQATGEQLDNIGETLGLERRGLTDDFYRSLIFLRLFQRNNRGTYQNILDLIEVSFGDDQVIIQKGAGYDLDIAVSFCEIPSDVDYVRALLIDGVVESLPAVTAVKIVEKSSTSVFGFQGNPYAVGYGVDGLPGGGQLSIERFTNRG